jgi:hypothetical protein
MHKRVSKTVLQQRAYRPRWGEGGRVRSERKLGKRDFGWKKGGRALRRLKTIR